MKQMAICDLALPILKPLKPASQLGFTPGLFVKLSNIIVSEKEHWQQQTIKWSSINFWTPLRHLMKQFIQ
jgi:hypothetical protein